MHSLQRKGIKLSFECTEAGDPNLVFIHGWCCDHSYFSPQISRFQALDYRVIAVDLRGHGQSAQPRQSYSMEIFAHDVAWLCDELAVTKAYFIGHSMGGNVAYELGRRRPDLAAGVVMIDSAVTRPAASLAAMEPFLRELEGSGYREALTSYVSHALAIPTDDRERLAHILADMTSVPQHVIISAFKGLRDYDPASEGLRLACAALYIAASEPQPRSDVERLRELVPGLACGQVVGSGWAVSTMFCFRMVFRWDRDEEHRRDHRQREGSFAKPSVSAAAFAPLSIVTKRSSPTASRRYVCPAGTPKGAAGMSGSPAPLGRGWPTGRDRKAANAAGQQ